MTDKAASKDIAGNAEALFDEFLIVLVQSGDLEARERLAARWWPRLARAANRLVGPVRAEDATQDALISVFKGLGRLREPSRFAPWAFAILQRQCADLLRKEAPMQEDHLAERQDCRQSDAFESLAITQALAALPPEQRFAAHLFFIEGFFGEAQSIPIGTAKSRLFHARRQLKAALSGDDL